MSLFVRANDALSANPLPSADEVLSLAGSDFLWAVTGVYIVSFLGLLSLCFTAPESNRVFHYLFTITLLVGATSYFAQASDLGWQVVSQADHLSGGSSTTRQVFYARYINWAVSFPAASLALGLLSGISWTTIVTNACSSWLWVATYLASADTPRSPYRWGFFAFGTLCWVIVALSTLKESHEAAVRSGVGRDYMVLAALLNVAWLLFVVAFGVGDGGNVLGVTGSAIFHGVVDILMIPVFSFAFIMTARKWNYEKLHLNFSEHRYLPPVAA